MMKRRFCKVIYLTTLMACLCSPLGAKRITMSKEVLMDKIQGGWAGQVIGCTYGGPTEFRYNSRIIEDDVKLRWDNDLIKEYYEKSGIEIFADYRYYPNQLIFNKYLNL